MVALHRNAPLCMLCMETTTTTTKVKVFILYAWVAWYFLCISRNFVHFSQFAVFPCSLRSPVQITIACRLEGGGNPWITLNHGSCTLLPIDFYWRRCVIKWQQTARPFAHGSIVRWCATPVQLDPGEAGAVEIFLHSEQRSWNTVWRIWSFCNRLLDESAVYTLGKYLVQYLQVAYSGQNPSKDKLLKIER